MKRLPTTVKYTMLKRILVPHHQLFRRHIEGLLSIKLRCYGNRVVNFNIACPTTAAKVADCIRENQSYQHGIFIECKAGPGILTNALLKTSSPSETFVCSEDKEQFLNMLKEQGNVVVTWNPLLAFVTKTDLNESFQDLKESLPKEEDSPLTMFGIVSPSLESKIIHSLALGLTVKHNIFNTKQLELFLFCSPTVYRKVLNARSAKRQGILYKGNGLILDLLFESKTVMKLSVLDFTPVFAQIPGFRKTKFSEDTVNSDEVYLLRLRPKPEIVSQFTPEELNDFFTFLHIILKSGKSRIIPEMEKLLPDCGLELISMGITMLDKIMFINPEGYLRIFKAMINMPNYEHSIMKQMLKYKASHFPEWLGHEKPSSEKKRPVTSSSQKNIQVPSVTTDEQQASTHIPASVTTDEQQASSHIPVPSVTTDEQQASSHS